MPKLMITRIVNELTKYQLLLFIVIIFSVGISTPLLNKHIRVRIQWNNDSHLCVIYEQTQQINILFVWSFIITFAYRIGHCYGLNHKSELFFYFFRLRFTRWNLVIVWYHKIHIFSTVMHHVYAITIDGQY